MVPREPRRRRRHDRERRAGRAAGRPDDRCRRTGGGPWVHRYARPLGIRAAGGPPGAEQDGPGSHHRGPRGASLRRAGDGPRGGRPDDGRTAHRAGLDDAGRISRPVGVRRGGSERRLLRGLGAGARLGDRLRRARGDRRGAGGDGGARGAGDGGGRVRARERSGLHPERVREHRGTHPADPGRRRLRGHLREPPAGRARRTGRRNHHRPRGGDGARDPPPELHFGGPDPGIRGDDRRGPRVGSGRDRKRLSLHRGVDLPAVAAAALGPGRRGGPDARAADRRGRPGPPCSRSCGSRRPSGRDGGGPS